MKVVFSKPRGANAPAKLLANAELIGFIPQVPNVKMVDLAIWESNEASEGPWVAFPGRQYTDGAGKKKTARFIRPVGEEWGDLNKLTAYILAEFAKWYEVQAPVGSDETEENPFA